MSCGEVDECSCEQGGDEDSQGGKQHALPHHRLGLGQGGLETTGEQDYGHREVADRLGQVVILETYPYAVGSGHHSTNLPLV